MFENYEGVQRFVDENNIEVINLQYCDLWGRVHQLTIPKSQFTPTLMERGLGFDASSVGLKSVKAGDMVIVPDLPSGAPDPFWETSTLSFLCKTLIAGVMEPYVDDPRNLAHRAERYLTGTGIADGSRWGLEFEFYVFDAVNYENEMHRSGYQIQSTEADWIIDDHGESPYIRLHEGYHAAPPRDKFLPLRTEISLILEQMGVPVKYHHHEVGSGGQMEIETPMIGLVVAGDSTIRAKYVTKMVANRMGKVATFMPKPLFGEAGNGLHFHLHLLKEDVNLFYDEGSYGYLSEIARQYVAGLLHHSASILAFTSPSTNSYRRLVPGFEAPVNAFYSLGNRSAAIRIPKYASQPDTVRIEFRPPDASSNPYLAVAAQLMAGLDGIRNELDPTELGFGPIDANIFSWSEEQRNEIKSLPTSLEEALRALEEDHEYLLAGDVFTASLIQEWIRYKREEECWQVRNRPHPYEFSMYLDV
jgi:glutamine synthetase